MSYIIWLSQNEEFSNYHFFVLFYQNQDISLGIKVHDFADWACRHQQTSSPDHRGGSSRCDSPDFRHVRMADVLDRFCFEYIYIYISFYTYTYISFCLWHYDRIYISFCLWYFRQGAEIPPTRNFRWTSGRSLSRLLSRSCSTDRSSCWTHRLIVVMHKWAMFIHIP